MPPELFVLALALAVLLLFCWAFRTLPGERWQIIGCLLGGKKDDGAWKGLNLTYYGFFTAAAYLAASLLFFILMRALSVPVAGIAAILATVLAVCMPASKWIALWVEGKQNTFTVGGASFAGLVIAPWVIALVNHTLGARMGFYAPIPGTLAAIAVAYAVGEGIGRLACISFGCCYGKPLSACPPWLQRLFRGRTFIFSGKTKKIAYAHRLDGCEVLPVQAVTAALLTGAGLLGCYAFLKGFAVLTFAGLLIVTQGWRILSEQFRADYRGTGRITAYQVMALLSVAYALLLAVLFREIGSGRPDLDTGLRALWDPGVILFFELLWVAAFLYTGRSRVTAATVRLHVLTDKI